MTNRVYGLAGCLDPLHVGMMVVGSLVRGGETGWVLHALGRALAYALEHVSGHAGGRSVLEESVQPVGRDPLNVDRGALLRSTAHDVPHALAILGTVLLKWLKTSLLLAQSDKRSIRQVSLVEMLLVLVILGRGFARVVQIDVGHVGHACQLPTSKQTRYVLGSVTTVRALVVVRTLCDRFNNFSLLYGSCVFSKFFH